jgi:hypothetical protein
MNHQREDLSELGFSSVPTTLATMELEAVARWSAGDRPLRFARRRVRVKRALNGQTDLPHTHR